MDKYKDFKQLIKNNVDFKENDWNSIESCLKFVSYKKGETIHYAGEVCKKLYFVSKGMAKMYYISENGREFVCHISYEKSNNILDNFSVDFQSFSYNEPSRYFIETITDCDFIEIDIKYFIELLNYSSFRDFNEKVKSILYSHLSADTIDTISLSALERYQVFIKRYASVYSKIPQYTIASYLGITPVALSRIKKRLDKSN